ncbi:MAG: hypothetical protein JWM15_3731 [Cryptosporangiaceae bacterium]|nr:hypothetical protein [Cryptosporangiaceae bacterium]
MGYLIAAAINAVMLYAVNVAPGWQPLPFLTEDTRQVLALLNLSLGVGAFANLVYVAYDPPWWKAVGDVLTTVVGMTVLVRIWQVFPFDFGGTSSDWALLARSLLVLAFAGATIGIVVQIATLLRRRVDNTAPH